jgi:hypothetical protein
MDKGTALYALTTLAQTCAALAAFVGAVGVFRIQSLEQGRQTVLENIRAHMGNPTMTHSGVLAGAIQRSANDPTFMELVQRHTAFAPIIRKNVGWFILFEVWNLIAILVSLLGLVYVDAFARCPYSPTGLAILSIGAVVCTGSAVVVWLPRN